MQELKMLSKILTRQRNLCAVLPLYAPSSAVDSQTNYKIHSFQIVAIYIWNLEHKKKIVPQSNFLKNAMDIIVTLNIAFDPN